eukprot:796437-Prorocentrum_minimum.AAC.2
MVLQVFKSGYITSYGKTLTRWTANPLSSSRYDLQFARTTLGNLAHANALRVGRASDARSTPGGHFRSCGALRHVRPVSAPVTTLGRPVSATRPTSASLGRHQRHSADVSVTRRHSPSLGVTQCHSPSLN